MDSGPAPVGPIPVSTAGRDDRSSTTDHPPRSPSHHPPRGPTPVRQVPSRPVAAVAGGAAGGGAGPEARRRGADRARPPTGGEVHSAPDETPARGVAASLLDSSPPQSATAVRLERTAAGVFVAARAPGGGGEVRDGEGARDSARDRERPPGNLGCGSADAAPGGGPGRDRAVAPARRSRPDAMRPPSAIPPGRGPTQHGRTPLRSGSRARHRPPATGAGSAGAQTPNFRAESVNAATARSTCSGRCAADNCTRMRAFPCGTTGKLNPIT